MIQYDIRKFKALCNNKLQSDILRQTWPLHFAAVLAPKNLDIILQNSDLAEVKACVTASPRRPIPDRY